MIFNKFLFSTPGTAFVVSRHKEEDKRTKEKKYYMKKVIVFLGLSILGLSAAAQDKINWHSIDEAVELAAKEPRVLVIDVYTDWCGWCKRMDATTFSDPEIVEIMNKNFYPVKLNAEGKDDIIIGDRTFKFVDNGRRGYHEIAAVVTRGRLSYPTISYVDAEGRVIEAAPGYKTPDQFRIYLDYYAGDAYKSQTFDEFSAAYAGEEKPVIQNL